MNKKHSRSRRLDKGPYLVWPAIKAFDDGKRPVNIEARNIVWQSAQQIEGMLVKKTQGSESAVQISFLWGKPNEGAEYGMLLRFPVPSGSRTFDFDNQFSAIVISGSIVLADDKEARLVPGSYFGNRTKHQIPVFAIWKNTMLYIKTSGKLTL